MAASPEIRRAEAALSAARSALEALEGTLRGKGVRAALELLRERQGAVIVTGVGKSGFIGMKLAATLTSLGRRAQFIHPVEALHGDLGAVGPRDTLLAISYSGGTPEVLKLSRYLKAQYGVPTLALTGNPRSALARLAEATLEVRIEAEGSPHNLAPMASTTATLALGDAVAAALVSPEEFGRRHFARLHPSGTLGLELTQVKDAMARGRAVPLAKATSSLKSALAEMTRKRLGVVGVVDAKGALSGVITDGDVRRFMLRHESIKGATVGEAMTKDPQTIAPGASLKDALALMESKGRKITTLFVTERRKPVGVLHLHSIVGDTLL